MKVVTLKVAIELNMVAPTFFDWEAKTGKSEFEASLDLMVRPCIKEKKKVLLYHKLWDATV